MNVIVTGAAGALGQAVASAFTRAGHAVWGTYRGTRAPAAAAGLRVDLLDTAAVRAAFTAVVPVDALVCCAGGYSESPVHALEPAEWHRLFDLNATTALNAIAAVLPAMRERGRGAIVTVASGAAVAGEPDLAAYTASKAALLRLTETVAAENPALHVNAVLPGMIDTPANRASMPDADFSAWTPPSDIADVLLWLCSAPVTGAAIPV